MQLEEECGVYGSKGPLRLLLLPEMCILQLLGFVQDMLQKKPCALLGVSEPKEAGLNCV